MSNTGTATIRITSVSINSGAPYTVFPSVAFDLVAGASQELSVKFSPTAEADAAATLTLTTNDPITPSAAVSLTGRGVRPRLELASTALDFGQQRVGTTSAPQSVLVKNTGTGAVRITGMSITAGASFAVSPVPAFTLPVGAIQELSVTFNPTTVGNLSANLTLTTDDAATPSVSVILVGLGVSILEMNPASVLEFGEVPVGMLVKRTVTLTNTSAAPVKLTSVSAVTAPFSVSGPGAMPMTLPAHSAITFDVSFLPMSEGPYSAFLSVTSDAANGPHHYLALTGVGTVPQAKFSIPVSDAPPIASLDFNGVRVGSSKELTVRLTNTGKAPLVVESVLLASSSSAFSYLGPTSISLAPGTYFDFRVSFRPTSATIHSETLIIKSNAVNGPTDLRLVGLGASPKWEVSPTALFLGDTRVGDQSAPGAITINNTGNADVLLQHLHVDGPFAVVLPAGVTLPMMIPVASSFTFEVIFKPSVQGDVAGAVSILSDSDLPVLKVGLAGRGTISAVETSVSAFDFGGQRVGAASDVLPLIIKNPGSTDLMITSFSHPSVFSISTSPLPLKIAAGQQVPVYVTFTPKTLGHVEGQLHIISNAYSAAPPVFLKGKGIDGRPSVTPAVMSFSGVEVGGPGLKQTVMLTNTGEHSLTIMGVAPPSDGAFTLSGLLEGTVLQPGEGWPFTVTFRPVVRGYVSTSAVIKSDSVMNPFLNLALDGTGMAAAVELLPNDVHFGRSNVGVSTTRYIAIKNTGEKELYVSNISFSEVPSGGAGTALDFDVGNGVLFPLVVRPAESFVVPLQFTPRAVGLRQARAIVYTNDKAAEVSLQGDGTWPVLMLSPSSLDFGNVLVGRPSAPRVLRFTNTGTGPLTVSSLTLGGVDAASFLLTSPVLPLTLLPAASSEVAVTLKPESERLFSAQLVVGSNDSGMPSVVVPMSGVAVSQEIQLSVSSLAFGQQLLHHTSSPRKVRISNNSEAPVTLRALAVEGMGASQFSLTPLPVPLVLAPGQAREVEVSFTPQAEAEVSCALKLAFDELSQPLEVSLQGKGIPAVLSITPAPLDFGGVRVGGARRDQPLTLTNLSGDAIVLAAPEVTYATGEPFLYDGASLQGRTLEPGKSVIVTVGYQPMVETLSETSLSFGTTTPQKPRSVDVQLKGRAMQRLLSVTPAHLDFGQVDVGTSVEPKQVTITNNSSQQQRVVVKLKELEGTPFTLETRALANAIPPEGTVTFSVDFEPQTAGEAENEVEVWLQGSTEAEALIPVTGSSRTEQAGGCGCGSTSAGSVGMLALLALVGLGSRRRRLN